MATLRLGEQTRCDHGTCPDEAGPLQIKVAARGSVIATEAIVYSSLSNCLRDPAAGGAGGATGRPCCSWLSGSRYCWRISTAPRSLA